MYEQTELTPLVRKRQAAGKWNDRGTWQRVSIGTLEYLPTRREIAAKWRLYRLIAGWHGAYKRAPRGDDSVFLRDVSNHFAILSACASRHLAQGVLGGKIRHQGPRKGWTAVN